MSQEEAQHLPARIGSERVGVRAARASARPSVPGTLQHSLLQERPLVAVALDRAGVGRSTLEYTLGGHRLQRPPACRLCDNSVAVDRMDRAVGIAVEDNGRD